MTDENGEVKLIQIAPDGQAHYVQMVGDETTTSAESPMISAPLDSQAHSMTVVEMVQDNDKPAQGDINQDGGMLADEQEQVSELQVSDTGLYMDMEGVVSSCVYHLSTNIMKYK